MGYAFISYSTKNQASAEILRSLLREAGIGTWMAPADIPAGSKYAQVINQAIKGCDCFVLLLSNAAQKSIWVAKEVERAVNYRKPVFTVKLEPVQLNDEFELYISTEQIIAVSELRKNDAQIGKLLRSVRAVTGCAAQSAAPQPSATKGKAKVSAEPKQTKKPEAQLDAIFREANRYHEKGDYQSELGVLLGGQKAAPHDPVLLLKLGRVYRLLNYYEKALECYREVEKRNPKVPTLYDNVAAVFYASGQYAAAKLYFEKALALLKKDPSLSSAQDAVLFANYGVCLGKLGDSASARAWLRLAKQRGYSQDKLEIICRELQIDPQTL